MSDRQCACSVFDTIAGELLEPDMVEMERCTAPATQEDLLCDECRQWMLAGQSHALAHGSDAMAPHFTLTAEEAWARRPSHSFTRWAGLNIASKPART